MSNDAAYIILNKKGTLAALDRTFEARQHTATYALVYRAKYETDEAAIAALVEKSKGFVAAFPHFKAVDYVCAVPSDKEYDLPRHLAAGIAAKLALPDITGNFI